MQELPAWAAIEAQKIAKATKSKVSIFSYVTDYVFADPEGKLSFATSRTERYYWYYVDGWLSQAFKNLEECVSELRKYADDETDQVATPEQGDSQ